MTRRCLIEDFGLSSLDAACPIEGLAHRVPLIAALVAQRSQNPAGQETVTGLASRVVAWTLHRGDHRGATWHDVDADVVWLLAARFHRSGEPDDAYPYFRRLDAQGRLLPTEGDYLELERSRLPTLAGALLDEAPTAIAEARGKPGTVVALRIGGRIGVRLLYARGDVPTLTLAVSNRIEPGDMPLPDGWLLAVVAAFFPETFPESAVAIGDWPLRPDETGFWEIAE